MSVVQEVPAPAEADPPWVICPACRQPQHRVSLGENLQVCPDCAGHHRLSAPDRLEQLLDPGSAEAFEADVTLDDPLGFVDSRPYAHRWHGARAETGLPEAVLVARGRIDGRPVVVAVMDFRFLGGSLGAAAGELITLAAEAALAERTPLLIVTASGGARMQEGAISLMQMAKTSQALGELDRAGILTVSLITDPTYGGVAASFATLTDVIIAEPGARLGFAGPRVIAQTIGETLPPGFQTAELLLRQGLIDAIRPRSMLRQTLGRLLSFNDSDRPTGSPAPDVAVTDPRMLPDISGWEAVRRARNIARPTTLDYLGAAFEEFEELRGDRIGGACPAIVGGLARLTGARVVVIGQQKGHTIAELAARNYGMPGPAGYRTAARLARLAGKLGVPLVTLVDTPGAFPGVEAERGGQSFAIADLIRSLSALPVPVVCVILGEGGSGGALALAVADEVLICANGVYSVISPEGGAAILWDDRAAGPAVADAMRLDAKHLLVDQVVDGVLPEPPDGNHTDHPRAATVLQRALGSAVRRLSVHAPVELVERRRERFRRYGSQSVTVPLDSPARIVA